MAIQLRKNTLLSDDNKKTFKAIIVLNEMINGNHQFSSSAYGDDAVLQPLFQELVANGYIISSGSVYKVSSKGRGVFDTFMKRYSEYLKVYDVFSFVDLEKGEFAFSSYFDFDNDDDWFNFTDNERFDDLRIAVAMFKKADPAEIVFMSFINENRFDTSVSGWQNDLMADTAWGEIEDICNSAIKPEDVGEDAMVDMINQGSELMIKLMEEEQKQNNNNNNYGGGGTTTTTIVEEETIEYYEPYYDPYYISPIWLVPLFIW
ncbi:hypothetical protein [Mucilaginibacter ginsenosidivorax]|uniref:Uncharacterized protein n=1 Tax=Mucilaginibacter ginsenosidivorax TaxID=862126 RepID=A0A5B8VWS7_9SPHI|nr:hypothetical protein [Mucilaginibacter ginsenosidivorax]QEC75909.1 hypothetical protein FSB76_08095 [Mucilaginibacter ginsenosidivorax]